MNPQTTSAPAVRSAATIAEYHTTQKYLKTWGYKSGSFADWLISQPKLTHATKLKHIRQARILAKENSKSWNLGSLPPLPDKAPPHFSDLDFQRLYQAFENVQYPKFILPEFRPLYWQTIIHLASITALRRESILGLKLGDINFNELYLHVPPENDKKAKNRYKPITSELAADILDLIRHYDKSLIHPAQYDFVFPWKHGTSQWYKCWQNAEKSIGKRFHLHDLKRFSGELALRAGATPLELQQHMDHSKIETTLKHYVRPQTTKLIAKFNVPIPDRSTKLTPLFGEGELKEILSHTINDKLRELGIEQCVSLDKFGLPTTLIKPESANLSIGLQPVKRKKKGEPTIITLHLLLPGFDNNDVSFNEKGGSND